MAGQHADDVTSLPGARPDQADRAPRALLVHPRPLPYQVTPAIAGPCRVRGGMSDPPATMGSGR